MLRGVLCRGKDQRFFPLVLHRTDDAAERKVDDEVDSMIDNFAGGDFEVESFVSDKNTDVDSVQFVIKTEAIKKEEVKVEEEKTEELNFWQKLLNLFRK